MNIGSTGVTIKLWGRIEEKLAKGEYIFIINDKYNKTIYSDGKYIILHSQGLFTQGIVLTIVLYTLSGFCFIAIIIFVLVDQKKTIHRVYEL